MYAHCRIRSEHTIWDVTTRTSDLLQMRYLKGKRSAATVCIWSKKKKGAFFFMVKERRYTYSSNIIAYRKAIAVIYFRINMFYARLVRVSCNYIKRNSCYEEEIR